MAGIRENTMGVVQDNTMGEVEWHLMCIVEDFQEIQELLEIAKRVESDSAEIDEMIRWQMMGELTVAEAQKKFNNYLGRLRVLSGRS